VEDMVRLERTERIMVRWMCGVQLKGKMTSAELNRWLGIECITDVVGRSHVERKDGDDLVSACGSFKVKRVRDRFRGRKTWEWINVRTKTWLNWVCIKNGLESS